jgi:hypothetical protein
VKFLCVQCDEAMQLVATAPPDRGSLSIVYACPTCGRRIAMLTNPYETQMVSSLGVRIGPSEQGAPADGAPRCPFSDVVQDLQRADASSPALPWTAEAQRRLQNIPEFVRAMARSGIEGFARERGYAQVNEEVLDRAKDFFGM